MAMSGLGIKVMSASQNELVSIYLPLCVSLSGKESYQWESRPGLENLGKSYNLYAKAWVKFTVQFSSVAQ